MTGSPAEPLRLPGGVRVCWTGRREGDLGPRAVGDVQARRRAVLDLPWSWLTQVHGATVVSVDSEPVGGVEADALVAGSTAPARTAFAIFTADCAPVALASPEGAMGAVHAGWSGLLAGVVEEAVAALRRGGASRVTAALGPCIHPECYEFSDADLARMTGRLGSSVAGRTSTGRPALDIPAAVAAALERAGAELAFDAGVCTACSTRHWSHRAARDPQRQAMVVWRG